MKGLLAVHSELGARCCMGGGDLTALGRAAASRIADSVSLAVALRAGGGSSTCPACSPHLQCNTPHVSCDCSGGAWVLVSCGAFLLGVIVTLVFLVLWGKVIGNLSIEGVEPIELAGRPVAAGISALEEAARRQIVTLRSRRNATA